MCYLHRQTVTRRPYLHIGSQGLWLAHACPEPPGLAEHAHNVSFSGCCKHKGISILQAQQARLKG